MIDGVMIKKLKVVPDDRGRLMECLRNDDELFIRFGQFYMTTTFPGVVKGWHLHDAQWDNIVCVKGMIKLVLFDGRGVKGEAAAPGQPASPTAGQIDQFFLGEHNPLLVRVPPGLWHGWKCVSTGGGVHRQRADRGVQVRRPRSARAAARHARHRL